MGLDLWRTEIATIHTLPAAMQSAIEVNIDLGKTKRPVGLMNQPRNSDK
jgi:hypothetical protein